MASEEVVPSDHQAAGDAGAGSNPLGDDLRHEQGCSLGGLHQNPAESPSRLLPLRSVGGERRSVVLGSRVSYLGPLGLLCGWRRFGTAPGIPDRLKQVNSGVGGAHPFGPGLAEVLHPVGHLSLALCTQLQAGPVSENDLEGVGPIRGVGSPAATALLPPGPEEEG